MAEIDDFLQQQSPNQDPQQQQPQQQPAQPSQEEQRMAVLSAENQRLRDEFEQMRAEMARFRAGIVQPQQPVEDPWQSHIREALREARVTPDQFVESPMETFVRGTAAVMARARNLWAEDVKHLNSQFRLDAKFEERYPDLYATDNRKRIVETVLLDLRGDPNFARLLGATETIPQALDVVAKNTYKTLGIPNPHEGGEDTEGAAPPPPAQRKGTYGVPGGSRVTGGGPVKEDTQVSEVGNMIKYLQGGGSRG
jgi:hypothetical protein